MFKVPKTSLQENVYFHRNRQQT